MAFTNNAKSTAKPVPFHSPCSPVSFGQRKQGGDQSPAEGMILSVQIAIISQTLNSYIEKKPDQLILL